MKALVNKIDSRISGYLFILPILIVSALYAIPVSAQVALVAKLNGNEVSAVIPILKAEVTGITKLTNAYASERDRSFQLFLDIKSGKTDPLDWIKEHSKHIMVPPEAKYEPECSRAASLGMLLMLSEEELAGLKPGANPTAIFTLGKEIRSLNRQVLSEPFTQESYEHFLESVYSITDQDYSDIKIILDRTIGFYTKNGFKAGYETLADGPSRTTVNFYHPEDEGYISGTVYHVDIKLYDPNSSETVRLCSRHPLGPSIEIKSEYKLLEKIFSSPESGNPTNEDTKNNLKKAGITEERYALIKASLITARIDSENPDAIEVPDFDFTPATDEEKEIAKIIAQMKADALARKSNITIYNQFKAELDPILDLLQQ